MTAIHWATDAGGAFATGSNWLGGSAPGTGDDAILDAAGATPYTVTTSSATVASIQTLITATLSITSGTFDATSGTGSGGNVGVIQVGDGAAFAVGGTVANSGTISLNASGSSSTLDVGATGVTLSGGGKVILTDNTGNGFYGANSSAALTNVDNIISGAGNLGEGRLNLVNQAKGVIDATGTKTLTINTGGETLTNAGLIEATGAGGLTITNATVTNTGTIESVGASLLTITSSTASGAGQILTTSGGHISLKNATINGETLTIVAGASLSADSGTSSVAATSFTNNGAVSVGDGDALTLTGTVANAGTVSLNASGSSSTLDVGATGVTLSGGGKVILADNTGNGFYGVNSSATLTNVDNIISGAGNLGEGRLNLVNQAKGVIDATGTKTLTINTGSGGETLTNAGLIEATGAGGLTITNATVTNTGTIESVGASLLTITSSTASGAGQILTTSGGHISLKNATINGETLTIVAGASLSADSGTSSVAATSFTNNGAVSVGDGDALTLTGTVANAGTVSLNASGSSSTLNIGATGLTLSGGGKVILTDNTDNNVYGVNSSATLTNADNTITGAGNLGEGQLNLVNQAKGVIDATGTKTLTINTGSGGETLTNAGLIEATGAGGLVITNTNVTNTGTIESVGASVLTITNATVSGAGQILTTSGGHVSLRTAKISGGTLTIVAGASLSADSGTSSVAATSFINNGAVSVGDGDALTLTGTVANAGTVSLNASGSSSTLNVSATGVTLSGGGKLILADNTSNGFYGANSSATLTNIDNTITGAGNLGEGQLNLVNQAKGVIDATGTNTLTINTGSGGETLTNAGLIEATGAGGLIITNAKVTNTGTIEAVGASVLTLTSATASGAGQITTTSGAHISLRTGAISGGTLTIVAGASLSADSGTSSVAATSFTNNGAVSVGDGDALTLTGTVANAGTVSLNASGSSSTLNIGATGLTLSGGGKVILTDNTDNNVYGVNSSATLTNADNTITGAGNLGEGQLNLVNQAKGVIDATGTKTLTINTGSGGETLTNAGLIEATGAGGLIITNSTVVNSGTIEAAGPGALTMQSVALTNAATGELLVGAGDLLKFVSGTLTNLSGTTLSGGIYDVGAGGTLQLADNNTITTLGAVAILDGAASVIQSLNTGTALEVTLDSTLTAISAGGALKVLSGRNFSNANAIANSGTIELGGGTLTTGLITDGSGSTLTGFGKVASVVSGAGAVTAAGGPLAFTAKNNSFSGALGGGEIDFTAGTDTLKSGSSLTASTIGLSGGAALTLNVSQTFAGTWNQGAATVNLGSQTLTLNGTSTFAGATVSGAGKLALGGAATIGGGTTIGAGSWSLAAATAVTLTQSLSYAGTFSTAIGSTMTVGPGWTLTLTGGSTMAGAITGTGALTLSGGTDAFNAGASLGVASVSIKSAAAVSVNGTLKYAGAFTEAAGTTVTVASSDTLTLSGSTTSIAGTIAGAGTLAFVGGAPALATGAKLTVASWSATFGAAISVNANVSASGSFTEDKTSSVTVASGDTLTLSGPGAGFAGGIGGAGTLALAGGANVINSGATVVVGGLSTSGGASVTLNENLSYGGTLAVGAGTTLTVGATFNLTLTGSANTIAGSVTGPGTLSISGLDTLNAGASISTSKWSLASATITVAGAASASAMLNEAATAAITVNTGGALALSGVGSTLSGAVGGAGTLAFSGGSATIASGAIISVANLSLSGSAAVTLNQTLSYAGALSVGANSTLTVGPGVGLTLTGAGSTLAGALTGTGSFTLASGGKLAVTGAAASISTSSVAIAGSLEINDGAGLTVGGTIANSGEINLAGATKTTALSFGAAGLTLSGGGALTLSNSTHNSVGATAAATLANLDNLISGAGTIGNSLTTLTNATKGVIDATGTAALILTTPGHVITNAGTIEATGTGGLVIQSSTISGSGGTLFAGAGSSITLTASRLNGGAASDVMNTAATGAIKLGNGSAAQVQGTMVNAGTISLASTGTATDLRILAGGVSLTGGGTVTLGGSLSRILGASTAATLTNVDNTISGAGFVGANQMTLINQAKGVIDAVGKGSLVVATAGKTLANAGLMEATGGGLLVLTGTTIDQSAGGTILAATGSHVDLSNVDIIGGTVESTGSGVLNVNVSGGVLDGTTSAITLAGLLQLVNGRSLTLEGSIGETGQIHMFGSTLATQLTVAAAGATLSGGGKVNLSNSVNNRIVGVSGAATLTNVNDIIAGSGVLGGGTMTLVNDAGGTILGNASAGLTIDTGANTIVNAGAIDAVNTGVHVTVKSAVDNSGKLFAAGGVLILDGAITGTGSASISGGKLDVVTASFTQNVTFTGATGVLELANSVGYTGTVKGLSLTGTSSLDLVDIGFTSGVTKASYVDNGSKTGGVLTVTDGTHTAHITLAGNYSASVFTTSSDGHGGTTVVDPSVAGFVQAIAGTGAPSSAPSPTAAHDVLRTAGPALAAPSPLTG